MNQIALICLGINLVALNQFKQQIIETLGINSLTELSLETAEVVTNVPEILAGNCEVALVYGTSIIPAPKGKKLRDRLQQLSDKPVDLLLIQRNDSAKDFFNISWGLDPKEEFYPLTFIEFIYHSFQQVLASNFQFQVKCDDALHPESAALIAQVQALEQQIQHFQQIEDNLRQSKIKYRASDRKHVETALRESAERERAIATAIQRIRQSLDLETIFAATTKELRQVLNCDRVAIYRFNPDWSGDFVAESVGNQWKSLLQPSSDNSAVTERYLEDATCTVKLWSSTPTHVKDTYLQETAGGRYTKGASFSVIPDIYQAGFVNCYVKLLEHFQARAYIIVPIFCGDRLWGLLANYQNSSPRPWKAAEVSIALQIGDQLAVAIQQAQLLEQMQKQSTALQEAAIAADAANRAKSEFLASMSHELRTPLNAILGFTQVMSRDFSLNIQQQDYLRIINRAGEHLLGLINDILEMSKIEAGRTTLNQTNFDLINLLKNLEEMLRLKAQSKGLQLIFNWAPDLPQYVKTDEGKLRQVLLNLLGNAIKFTPTGYVLLRSSASFHSISTDLEHPELTLHFEVEDTGPGIEPEDIPHIFEPFGQTELGQNIQQGTGLGLPISQKFVQLMGGNMQVTSTPGKGSIFTFEIQALLARTIEVQSGSQPKVLCIAPNQPDYRILVVDDASDSRLLLVHLLSSIGFQVREAKNGRDAIALWQSWQPHLICMDMRMPIMDGYEATKQIKATLQGQSTAIIALTASAFEEERKTILSAGCNDFIRKPFHQAVLLEKISQYLGVSYICEAENQPKSIISDSLEKAIAPADFQIYLARMSPNWIARVRQAAFGGSDDQILALLQQIPPEFAPLAKVLATLAQNFQFEKIIELTQ